MPNFKFQLFNYRNLSAIFSSIAFFGCASIQTPQGGPKDTKPPKVVNMVPKNQTRNFDAKKILIQFDEYFKIQNETKEFSISPELEKAPILKIKKKILEITLPDTLEKNTTYTLNFGKAIADINEGNVIKNLSYVFSTGKEIDSLSLSGKVSNSLTGDLEKDVTVFILPAERDSLFGKKRPSIYTLTDSAGNYKLNNLRKGTYKVYALKESGGGDKIYQQSSDEVGFLKDPVIIDKNIDNVNLQVFKETAPNFRVLERKINNDGSISLSFTQQLKQPQLTITEPADLDVSKKVMFNKTNDTAKVWLNDMSFDSVKVAVSDQGKLLQTVSLNRGKKDSYTRDITPTDNAGSGKLSPYQRYTLNFPSPIISADPSKIIMLDDSVKRTNFQLIKDSVNFLKYYITFPWKNKRKYDIKFLGGAFTGLFNTKSKEFRKAFMLDGVDNYGSQFLLNVTIPDTTINYIVEMLNEKKTVIKSYPISSNTKLYFNNYPVAKYLIRVIYDQNKNGKWDTGNVQSGIQPEKVWYSKDQISLRPNWDIENNLVIPPPPKDN